MAKCEICEGRASGIYECFNCETKVCYDCVINCSKYGYDFCSEECRGCITCDEGDKCKQYLDARIDMIDEHIRTCLSWTESQTWKKIKKGLQEMRDEL